jgi:hypothetical protein
MAEDDRQDVTIRGQAGKAHATAPAPRVFVTAGPEWMIEGYIRALGRFRDAVGLRGEPIETFLPLFEALNWAASVIEHLQDADPARCTREMQGVRYVRNRVHHDWAAALVARDFPGPPALTAAGGRGRDRGGGATYTRGLISDWFWKPLDNLPPAERPDPVGEPAYVKLLANRQAREVLEEIERAFGEWRDELRG